MDNIRKRLLSDENIFLSIYLVESYVQNTELLNKEDRHLLESVKDIFDITLVEDTIEKVKNILEKIIDFDEEYFDIDVYFKPKKYDNGPIFRPLHTASLINQIAMVAMLQILIYDIDNFGKLVPSEISRLIPSNFYGNRVSFDGKKLFKSWQDQYQDYTGKANELLYNYCETLEYSYEVSLDLKDFFPSINPSLLYTYICTKLPLKLSEEELSTIKVIIKKLLFFKLNKLTELEMLWYVGKEQDDFSEAIREQCLFAKGIPQGLPHTYFIANIYIC